MVGGTRTVIGMATGRAYFGIIAACGLLGHRSAYPVAIPRWRRNPLLAGLLPFRIAEWWLLLWISYDRHFREVRKDWRTVGLATAWSYVLDAPAILGFLVVGSSGCVDEDAR